MNRHRSLLLLAAVAASTTLLGACGKGSPTEPTPLVESDAFSATSAASSVAAPEAGASDLAPAIDSKRRGRGRGGDDGSADDNGGSRGRGRGSDDGPGDDRGGRGGRGGRGNGGANPTPTPTPPGGGRPGQAGLEFEGSVVAVDGNTLRLAGGARIVVNGQTQWSGRGDLFTLAQVAGSVAAGAPTRVEGRGTRQADGAVLALTLKAEVDN